MNNKVKIIIEPNQEFSDGSGKFTSVDASTYNYGSASPCRTDEEIDSAIAHAKEMIRNEGDIPVIEDLRIKQDLGEWCK